MHSRSPRGAKEAMEVVPHDYSFLSMISAQTPLAFVARENRFTLFRIML
jgi:hypothetical protein